MKKYILSLTLVFALMLTGCSNPEEQNNELNHEENIELSIEFSIVEKTKDFYVVYDKQTKVMYAVSNGAYNRGTLVMLVNSDGSPKLYKGE